MTLTSPHVQKSSTFPRLFLASITILAGCAAPPALITVTQCPVCNICTVCSPPTTLPLIAEPITPPPSEAARGRLERAQWDALPRFNTDNPTDALGAFLQSCAVLKAKTEWQAACNRAQSLSIPLAANAKTDAILQFFRESFDPFRVVNADESETGLVTGYYEPLVHGSRVQTAVYKYPVYASPQDLITIDLSDVYPDLKFRRLRGRLVGNKLVPYLERSEISADSSPLKGLEIAYVDNAVELFFLEIQGSGQIQLTDGSRLRVGYANQNGHPFRSLAGLLIRRGEIKAERASMQGIKEWARRHPARVQQFMNANPSFVFFKELPGDLSGPIGTLGVPLTAERSIAIDPRVIPLGVPVFLSTTFPGTRQELNRLMVAQDTGGAINGAVRADFYWGFGDDAGAQAGKMKQQGKMWVLLPKGYDPNAVAVASHFAGPRSAAPPSAEPQPAPPVTTLTTTKKESP
ncbi:MAG: MltA domain-containing protein [Betaproteobacteria bacterium]|nr:MltA domain-containing protein [Betaproteobacteria bacterium]